MNFGFRKMSKILAGSQRSCLPFSVSLSSIHSSSEFRMSVVINIFKTCLCLSSIVYTIIARSIRIHSIYLFVTTSLRIMMSQPKSPQCQKMAVLLFGYAGSSFRQLEKHSLIYNKLGYKTLSCILPLPLLPHYEVQNIVDCSRQVGLIRVY